MPNDIAVSVSSPSANSSDLVRLGSAGDATSAPTNSVTASGSLTKATVHNTGTLFANPTFELNADLGIVVIQFRNAEGTVTSQIPSQKQLDAYLSGSAQLPQDEDHSDATPAVGDAA